MREELEKLLSRSYSPYSNYPVAAMVTMVDGRNFYGVNIENASYGATVCAERVAIFNAVLAGYQRGDFKISAKLKSSVGKSKNLPKEIKS